MKPDVGKKKKSSIEESSMINEIIKRDNKFFSINKSFHLDVKNCKNKIFKTK